MGSTKRNIEVCFSPALFPSYRNPGAIAVITDILRATSAIVTAFENGVERIIPVGTLQEAKEYKDKGFMVAAERDGMVRDFADFGNSPFNFTPEKVAGRQIVYSTTNGTRAIHMASECREVLIGAYLNFTAVSDWLENKDNDVIILCAGWKTKFNLEDRMKGVVGSMDKLPFKDEELDLIWAEGSIYNIGFEKGLVEWRKFLKKGGYVAVSEASWFTEKRPEEIDTFWKDAYPEIDTIAKKVAVMQKAGYLPVVAFILPENCWIDNFYKPQIAAQEKFLKKHAGNKTAEEFIVNERREAELYGKYKEFYGYVFYIGKKR